MSAKGYTDEDVVVHPVGGGPYAPMSAPGRWGCILGVKQSSVGAERQVERVQSGEVGLRQEDLSSWGRKSFQAEG